MLKELLHGLQELFLTTSSKCVSSVCRDLLFSASALSCACIGGRTL